MTTLYRRSLLTVVMLVAGGVLIGGLTAAQSSTPRTGKQALPQEAIPVYSETPIIMPYLSPRPYFPPTFTPTSTPAFDSGQVLTVTKLEDTDDGQCAVKSCSLREAIKYASWGSTINFAPGVTGSMTLKDSINIAKKNDY